MMTYIVEASIKRISHVLAVHLPESPINVERVLLRVAHLMMEGHNVDELLAMMPVSQAEKDRVQQIVPTGDLPDESA